MKRIDPKKANKTKVARRASPKNRDRHKDLAGGVKASPRGTKVVEAPKQLGEVDEPATPPRLISEILREYEQSDAPITSAIGFADAGNVDQARRLLHLLANRARRKDGLDLTEFQRTYIADLFDRLANPKLDPLKELKLRPRRGNPAWKHYEQDWKIYQDMLRLIDPDQHAVLFDAVWPSPTSHSGNRMSQSAAAAQLAKTGAYKLSAKRLASTFRKQDKKLKDRAFPVPE